MKKLISNFLLAFMVTPVMKKDVCVIRIIDRTSLPQKQITKIK